MTLLSKLNNIVEQGKKFHDPQMILVMLDRLAHSSEEASVLIDWINEANAEHGVETRKVALENIAYVIGTKLNAMDDHNAEPDAYSLLKEWQHRFNMLVNDYNRHDYYVAYSLENKHLYQHVTYPQAKAVLHDCINNYTAV